MRIDLYFPKGLSEEECQNLVTVADTTGRKAFDGEFGFPSVHGMVTVRPERDTDTLVCVITMPKISRLSEQSYITGWQHFVETLMRAFTEMMPERLIRIESPDGSVHLFTWNDEPLVQKRA